MGPVRNGGWRFCGKGGYTVHIHFASSHLWDSSTIGCLKPSPLLTSAATPLNRMRYSHLGCNVGHEDIAYALGVDTHKEKMLLKHVVEEQRDQLPAEQ